MAGSSRWRGSKVSVVAIHLYQRVRLECSEPNLASLGLAFLPVDPGSQIKNCTLYPDFPGFPSFSFLIFFSFPLNL